MQTYYLICPFVIRAIFPPKNCNHPLSPFKCFFPLPPPTPYSTPYSMTVNTNINLDCSMYVSINYPKFDCIAFSMKLY